MRGAVILVLLGGCLGEAQPGADAGAASDMPVQDLTGSADDGSQADAATSPPDLAQTGVPFVFVSGYSPQIARYRLDTTSGMLTSLGTTAVAGNPSFLAIDKARGRLYAADEAGSQVRGFSMNASGALTPLNSVSSGGSGPAHLSIHPSGNWVLVANYGDGKVTVIPVQSNGNLGAATDNRTAGANAHQIFSNPAGTVVYVPCKGDGHVAQYSFDATLGKLAPLTPPTMATAVGAGPRHMALHPTRSFAYLINELDNTMSALSVDGGGRLSIIHSPGTLPAGFMGNNTTAEVWVHPSGAYVYGSNRGDNSIVRFSIDQSTGRITLVDHVKTGGNTPRSFHIDPTARFVLAANQNSNLVTVLKMDGSGALTATGQQVTVTSPAFVETVYLPGP
jgi:6-phosphogluconolactonase